MAGEWPIVSLDALTLPERPITYGVVKPGDEDPNGVIFVRGGDISNGRIATEQLRTITKSVSEQYRRTLLQGGELLVSLVGNPGEVAIAPVSLKGANIARQVGLISLRNDVDPRYVQYYLRSPLGKQSLGARSLGSVQSVINLRDLKRVELPLPPLKEQRAIAHILGTLDDKIELNRRMNQTLEAMARALFKSWFVDFDGIPAEDIQESELGLIPKGWRIGSIEDLCASITSGGTPARKNPEFWDRGTIPWFKTGELQDGPLLDSEEKITEAALRNSSCKLWPSGTILFALYASPTVGRLGILSSPGTSNQAAAGLIAKDSIGLPFLRRTLIQAREKLQSIAVGAAQQNINLGILKSHRIALPPEDIARRYSELVYPWDTMQSELAKQAQILTRLRDTLLPRLVSGKLRIGEAA